MSASTAVVCCLIPLVFFILAYNATQRGNSPVVAYAIGAALAVCLAVGQAVTGDFGWQDAVVVAEAVVFAVLVFAVKK